MPSVAKIVAKALTNMDKDLSLDEVVNQLMPRLKELGHEPNRNTVYTYASKMRNRYPISNGASHAVDSALKNDLARKVDAAQSLLLLCDGSVEECVRIINGVKQLM